MRRKVSGLYLVLLAASCTHPSPQPVTKAAAVEDDAPRFFSLPAAFRDSDLVCLNVDQPGTCVTIAELRQFLVSKKAEQ